MRLLLTSIDDAERAEQLAAGLIACDLAACVQISSPVTSHYRWQGEQERASERVLTIKLRQDQVASAMAWLAQRHPYDTPELVVLDASASVAYAAWMEGRTP
ncbi:MAG: divalent-cation tolerance protein CutA [Mariprofundales bacterium]